MSQGGRRETASASPSSSGPGVASFSFSSLLPGSVSGESSYILGSNAACGLHTNVADCWGSHCWYIHTVRSLMEEEAGEDDEEKVFWSVE